MHVFDPEDLARWTGGRWASPAGSPITGFCADSRSIGRGQAFVALKTAKRDGHAYLADALKGGASAALVARADPAIALAQLVVSDPLAALQAVAREHRRSFKGLVVGVTGSAGKTSTKEILALLLGGEKAGVLATVGNLNNQIGVALTLTRLEPGRHSCAVVEAGISAPGEMAVLAGMIQPDIAVVTLVGPAHLEELGGLEGVAREKAALFGALRDEGTCIFPSQCEGFAAFRALPAERCLVVEPSRGKARPPAGRCRFSVSHSATKTEVAVDCGEHPALRVALPRVTDGMAQNVALGVCAALRAAVAPDQMAPRLAAWRPSPLRGEWRTSEGLRRYLDCYNANPASMADALSSFAATAPEDEPRLYLIGCMEELGGASERYHRDLGRSLPLRAQDHAIVIGGMSAAVLEGGREAGFVPGQVRQADSVESVSAQLGGFRGSVFVKGSRRHELERAFAGSELAEVSHA